MPELPTEDQIAKFLDNANPNVPFGTLNPDMAGIASRLSTPKLTPEQEKQRFIATEQSGIPLDVESGAPWLKRIGAAFQTEPDAIIKYWQNRYGDQNVRQAKDGSIIVKLLDPDTGNLKEMTVDEKGMSGKDVLDLVGIMPEIGMAIAGVRSGKAIPKAGRWEGFWGRVRDALMGSVGTEVGGAAKELVARPLIDVPTKPLEVLGQHAENVLPGAAMNLGMEAAGKVVSKTLTPFGEIVPGHSKDLKQARKYFQRTDDIDFKPSAGQISGNPFFLRSEAQMPRVPGASAPFVDLREQQLNALRQIKNRTLGLPKDATETQVASLPGLEETTEQIQAAVEGNLDPVMQRISNARQELVQNSQRNVMFLMDQATGPARTYASGVIGDSVRRVVNAARDDFKRIADTKYNAMRGIPGGDTKILVPPNLRSDALKYLEQDIPTAEVTKVVNLPIINPTTGKPFTRTIKVKEVMDKFVPPDVVSRLKQLSELGDGPFSLSEMIQMRNDVDNAIAVGESIPGVQSKHLKSIRHMLTNAMDDSVNAQPSPALKNAWKDAEQYYKDNVGKFHTRLINSILRKSDEPGFIGNKELFDRVISGSDRLEELKGFLGPASAEFGAVKRRIADIIFDNATLEGQTTLNAKKFLRSMHDMYVNNRELFDEVYGSYGTRMMQQSQLMAVGQADKLDRAILEQGIKNPKVHLNLRKLIRAEEVKDRLYQNEFLEIIGKQSAEGKTIDPKEFLGRVINSAKPKQVTEFMAAISHQPETVFNIRARTLLDLFDEVARPATYLDKASMRVADDTVVSAAKLNKILKDSKRGPVLKALLLPDQIERLEKLVMLLRPSEMQEKAFASAGGIAGGMLVNAAYMGDLAHVIDKVLHNYMGAVMLNVPLFRQYVGNNLMTPAASNKIIKTLLYSRPLVELLAKDFGNAAAQNIIDKNAKAVDAYTQELGKNPSRGGNPEIPTAEEIDKFLDSPIVK